MDLIYDIFNDIELVTGKEELSNSDELLAKKLCFIDYLSQNDLENAFLVFSDIEEMGSSLE